MFDRKHSSLAWLVILFGLVACAGCELRANRSASSASKAEEAPPAPPSVMDEGQREYLWDIESHGNKLARTNYGLKTLGVALSKADRKGLENILAADFQGETL